MVESPFKLIKRLGEGEFGEVWLGLDEEEKGEVAVKFLRVKTTDPAPLTLFKQEFGLLTKLRHPHLAYVYHFGYSEEREEYFFTSEYAQGTDFFGALQGKPLSYLEEAFVQILSALDYIHSEGVIHFDIKAGNVLVEEKNGRPFVKLIDFGISSSPLLNPGQVRGTLAYLAPEFLVRAPIVDHRADLYSLGLLSLKALTGCWPFDISKASEVTSWHLRGEIPHSILETNNIPPYWRDILKGLLQKNPSERFSSARVVLNFLNLATGHRFRDLERSLKGIVLTRGPLVQRETILNDVRSRIDSVLTPREKGGSEPMVTISGERGIGKTRLLEEIRHASEVREMDVFEVPCDWKIPLWPRLEHILQLATEGPPSETTHAPYAGREIGFSTSEEGRLQAFLKRARSDPFCLLIDDFQKGDPEARRFFERLSFHVREGLRGAETFPFVVVIATEEGSDSSLPLPRLTPDGVSRYVRLVLGEGAESEKIAERLHDYSGGLPLLVVEGLKYISSSLGAGLEVGQITLPVDHLSLYADRLRTLGIDAHRLLSIAALLFRPVRESFLRRLAGLSDDEFFEAFNRCRKGDFLVLREERGIGKTIGLTSQAAAFEVIGLLSDCEKTRFQGEIAEALLREPDSLSEEIASHWEGAGEIKRARASYEEAGMVYEKKGITGLAGHCYSRAFFLSADDPAGRYRLGLKTVSHLILGGLYEKAEKILEELKPFPTHEGWNLTGWLLFKKRDFDESRRCYEEALRGLPDDSCFERVRLLNALADIDLQLGKIEGAVSLFQESANLEESLSPEERLQIENNNLGLALSLAGRIDEALKFYDEKIARLPESRLSQRASCLNAKGYVLIKASRFAEAATVLREALEAAESSQAYHNLFSILGNLLTSTLRENRYTEGLSLLQKLMSYERRFGTTRDVAFNTLRQGSLYLTVGMMEAARESLDKGKGAAVECGDSSLQLWFLFMEGYWEKEFGSNQEACRLFREVKQQAREKKVPDLVSWSAYAEAEVRFDEQGTDEADSILEGVPADLGDEELKLRLDLLKSKIALQRGGLEGSDPLMTQLSERASIGHFKEILWEVYDLQGQIEWKRGRETEAKFCREKAQRVVREIAGLLPQEYRARYLALKSRRKIFEPFKEVIQMPSETFFTQVLKMGKKMLSERDPQKILDFVTDTAIELSGAEEGLLLLLSEGGAFEPRVARNIRQESLEDVTFSRSVADEVMKSGAPLLTQDVAHDDRFAASASVVGLPLKSIIGIPLKVQNRVIGVLYLATRQKVAPFQREFVSALGDFADQATLAFQNATLLEEKMAANRKLEADLLRTRDDLHEKEVAVRELEALVSKKRRRTLYAYDKIVGASKKMEEVLGILDKITNAVAPVFIFGETGTGKELVARAIHENSTRRDKPFMAINCSAFTETILESELFGYLKGAFTGADRDRKGLFEEATGGVVFLDEVGDMSLSMQAKLLRVIQEQEVLRVGGRAPTKIDVRIVSASNKDLAKLVREGKFREDLYYRIAGMTVKLPSLRERREDIPLLVKHFIEKIRKENKITRAIRVGKVSLQKMIAYDWPGNIRELEQCLTNASLLSERDEIHPEEFLVKNRVLPEREVSASPSADVILFSPDKNLDDYEREIIGKVLSFCAGNKSEAARRLGLSRLTLYKKLKEYHL